MVAFKELARAARAIRAEHREISQAVAFAWARQAWEEKVAQDERLLREKQEAFRQRRLRELREERFCSRLQQAPKCLEGARAVERGFRFPVEFYPCGRRDSDSAA